MTTVIFSHGQESGPWGTKIRAMAELVRTMGCGADSIDYQGIADPAERVEKCVHECAALDDQLILVGSSMGGHVATAAAARVGAAGLFVLAPAYFMEGYEDLTPSPPPVPRELRTLDGEPVDMRASVRSAATARLARERGVAAIGLVRTEFLLPEAGEVPDHAKVAIDTEGDGLVFQVVSPDRGEEKSAAEAVG